MIVAARPKRPRDPVQLAKAIGDIATGQAADVDPDAGKNPAAVELGRLGGKARAAKRTADQRSADAKRAAAARAKKPKKRLTEQPSPAVEQAKHPLRKPRTKIAIPDD